jgi:hypothetical protein
MRMGDRVLVSLLSAAAALTAAALTAAGDAGAAPTLALWTSRIVPRLE